MDRRFDINKIKKKKEEMQPPPSVVSPSSRRDYNRWNSVYRKTSSIVYTDGGWRTRVCVHTSAIKPGDSKSEWKGRPRID